MPGLLVLTLLSYVGSLLAFTFATLSLACGLYYLAELVEEYTVLTKKIIKALTVIVAVIHVLLLVDGLPFTKIAFSLACHGVYTLNLSNFPYISLTSPPFLLSCVLVLVDHFMWFQYFSRHYYTFMTIASFFGICVWMIPFSYFISLSANDNALPSFDRTQENKQKKNGILKGIFGFLLNKKDTIPTVAVADTLQYPSHDYSARPTTPSSQYSSSYNPDKNQLRPDYPISRPSSSNSNYSQGYGGQQQQQQQQSYASSSSVYTQSSSTIGSRF